MATQTTCGVLGCTRVAAYRFASGTRDHETRCRWHRLVHWPVGGRAITLALIVGTILTLINQSDVIRTGNCTALVATKIGLTYLVPFSVSTYSAHREPPARVSSVSWSVLCKVAYGRSGAELVTVATDPVRR